MTKLEENALQEYCRRLMQEQESLVGALRPFATALPVVDKRWTLLSDGQHPSIVLTYRHLMDADEALRRLGLFYPLYLPTQGKN